MKSAAHPFAGLFGKLELEETALFVVEACGKAGTWDVKFSVPGPGPHHVGMTHLISRGYLRPVPGMSYMWVVTQEFVDRVKEREETGLPHELSNTHGLYSVPGAGTVTAHPGAA